jgi:hypothetical protein
MDDFGSTKAIGILWALPRILSGAHTLSFLEDIRPAERVSDIRQVRMCRCCVEARSHMGDATIRA